jgi:hypothetical protein
MLNRLRQIHSHSMEYAFQVNNNKTELKTKHILGYLVSNSVDGLKSKAVFSLYFDTINDNAVHIKKRIDLTDEYRA